MFLAAMFGCLMQGVVCGLEARDLKSAPVWHVPEAATRLVVGKAEDEFFLVQVPVQLDQQPVASVRVFAVTNEVACRIVWRDLSSLTVLVDGRNARRRQTLKIYPVPGAKPATVAQSGLIDPAPVYGTARRTAGMDYPKSLHEIGMLETRCDGKPAHFAVSDFSKLGQTFETWYRGDWTRKNHLVDLRTWLLVPEDGTYVFGLAGVAPSWLLVDGQEMLAHPAGQPHDTWTAGKEMPLQAGLRRIVVRTVCRQKIDTGLAWKRAGAADIATNVLMITGGALHDGRWERRSRRLHPFATAESLRTYCFHGVDEVFVPFCLTDGTVCWGTNHVASWSWGTTRAPLGAGETLTVTLRQSELPAWLWLQAKAGDGEEANYQISLAYTGPLWAEYRVSTRVTGVPAVCYEYDRVQPVIRIRSSAPDGLEYELVTEIVADDGTRSIQRDSLKTEQGWARVYLASFAVAAVARVDWKLNHHGVTLSCGKLQFQREPHDRLPDAVSGGLLKTGDMFVVLVTSRAVRERAVPQSGPETGTNGVVVLDGFMFGGQHDIATNVGTVLSGLAPGWRGLDLQALEQRDNATGMALLLPFTAIRQVLPAERVVFAPSLLAISREGGTAGFARRLSAMAGLLASPVCGQPRVWLVVPPPFDVLPGCGCTPGNQPCAHAVGAREYAALVMQTADAHGLETIDLYTAFMTADTHAPLVLNGMLTDSGRKLARQLIQRKLSAR